jgi:hypothetical protein
MSGTPTTAIAPAPEPLQPRLPEPAIPEVHAVTLPAPPRIEPLPKQ